MIHSSSKRSTQVLVTGASGYLGQFLLDTLCKSREWAVSATFNSHEAFWQHPYAEKMGEVSSIESARTANRRLRDREQFRPVNMDITDEASIRACLGVVQPDVIIHCAAVSSPAACERNPQYVEAINYPVKFMNILKEHAPDACFIFLSTDHVYDGRRVLSTKGYTETSPAFPLNVYGKTKYRFEQWIRQNWPCHVILRSSVIYGPPVSCRKAASKQTSLLQFMTDSLQNDDSVILFGNERRNFVFIDDVVTTIHYFVDRHILEDVNFHHIFNLGGPQCLSRVEFGQKVCQVYGFDAGKIQNMTRNECKEDWAHVCKQAENLCMVSSRLCRETGLTFSTVDEALEMCQRKDISLRNPFEKQMTAFSSGVSSDHVDGEEMIDVD